jgi:hypothetical protein
MKSDKIYGLRHLGVIEERQSPHAGETAFMGASFLPVLRFANLSFP